MMPKIYRAMESKNNSPVIGDGRNKLGVRPVDITPDGDGYVAPVGRDGMSVNPSISVMLSVPVPRRWRKLDARFRAARCEDPVEVFTHGEGRS